MRICGWSGPRNVSTALMRSFEARGDCDVVDEPLYAAYLAATGKDHPGRDEILAAQPTDAAAAWAALRSPAPRLRYEKHMAHHWLPGHDPEWIGEARHFLLVRDPARVVASYARVREDPLPEDLGLLQQVALRDALAARGPRPVVIDGDELAADPARMLPRLCGALGVPYTDRMLRWAPGPRATDGVWARHWYAAVAASTGFSPPSPPAEVPPRLAGVVAAVRGAYASLARDRL